MNEQEMREMMVTTVNMATEGLSDIELAVLNNVAQLDSNPHGRTFDYDTVKGLFTEAGDLRMHEETKIALASVVSRRLS